MFEKISTSGRAKLIQRQIFLTSLRWFPRDPNSIEYLSILKNIAITAGFDGDDRDLMQKGLEILKANNDRVQQELDSIWLYL